MEIREYTLAEIRDFIRYLQGIYDGVRLVDPVECKEIMTGEDGVWAGPDCYAVWGGRSRCRNCTSYEARRTGRRRTRDEMLDGRTVHIQSVPIRLRVPGKDAFSCVIEMISAGEAEDDIMAALFNRYILIYEIDLVNDWTRVIYESGEEGSFGMFREGRYSDFVERYSRERVSPELSAWVRDMGTPENLRQALMEKDYIDGAYTVNYGKWRSVEVRVAARKNGVPVKALLCFHKVDDDRAEIYRLRQEQNRSKELLKVALKQARQANNAKTVFLSNISHDIRTPMNAILGYTALALDSLDDREKLAEYLGGIRDSGSHMLELVNNVLDLVRIESGRMTLKREEADLREIMTEIISIIRPMADQKHQTILTGMERVRHTAIYCDRNNTSRILLNLLQNAVKYTPEQGRIHFTVTEKECEIPGYGSYEFVISDNGCGISPAFIDSIFEPFEREKNTTVSGISGNGLGLSIVKKMTDIAGGSIEVESQPGVGSTFRVHLEYPLPGGESPAGEEKKHAAAAISHDRFKGRCFLVVEDNMVNNTILCEMLERMGAAAESVLNGAAAVEAVQTAEAGHYDCILMDVMMPVMGGYEASAGIRSLPDPDKAAVPIIGISANAFREDREKALAAGMNDYLAKPVDVEELAAALEKAAGRPESTES